MKEKTVKQIENMKKQTIGVEIEMANISRERAIRTVGKFFESNPTFMREYDSYDSYIYKDPKGRTWRVMRDSSIQARRDSEKAELVTPILKYEDIEDLQEIVRQLRHAGAISNPEHGCGVHIHIGADGHTPQTLRNLANMMASHEELLIDALTLDQARVRTYANVVDKAFLKSINLYKPTTMAKLADLWYAGSYGSRSAHYNRSRYRMLNLHSTFTKGTIEFRLF